MPTDHAPAGPQPIGSIIDGLDIRASLAEGALVAGALVVLKVISPDGEVTVAIVWEGINWMERVGMLRSAEQIELGNL